MFWVMLAKPFVGLLLFGAARVLAWILLRSIPAGRVRSLLGRKIGRR